MVDGEGSVLQKVAVFQQQNPVINPVHLAAAKKGSSGHFHLSGMASISILLFLFNKSI
jgi:hypothetical protein